MVCALIWRIGSCLTFCLGIYQDFQKEGKIGKKDQAEQAHA